MEHPLPSREASDREHIGWWLLQAAKGDDERKGWPDIAIDGIAQLRIQTFVRGIRRVLDDGEDVTPLEAWMIARATGLTFDRYEVARPC